MIVFEDLTFISMADVGKAASIFLTIKKSPNMSEKITRTNKYGSPGFGGCVAW